MRARQWVPELGSFLSIDEFAFHDARSTLWGWPRQNPIRWRDPSGRTPEEILDNPDNDPIGMRVDTRLVWEHCGLPRSGSQLPR